MGDMSDDRCACGHARGVHRGTCGARDDEYGDRCCTCRGFRQPKSARERAIAVMGAAQLCALNAEGLEVHEASYVEGLHRKLRAARIDAQTVRAAEGLRERLVKILHLPGDASDDAIVGATDSAVAGERSADREVEQLREQVRDVRARDGDRERLCTDFLAKLRELTWDVAARHFEHAPDWTAGEECLDHLRTEFEKLRGERDTLHEEARGTSYELGRIREALDIERGHAERLRARNDELQVEADRWAARVRELEGRLARVRSEAEGRAA